MPTEYTSLNMEDFGRLINHFCIAPLLFYKNEKLYICKVLVRVGRGGG